MTWNYQKEYLYKNNETGDVEGHLNSSSRISVKKCTHSLFQQMPLIYRAAIGMYLLKFRMGLIVIVIKGCYKFQIDLYIANQFLKALVILMGFLGQPTI